MNIKQVIIKGFKSYKEKTTVDLDPNFNVIVGRNGFGKSSFLLAIQFIVNEKYFAMHQSLRQELIHNDVETAEVLLIFDNSDERFPLNKKEVTLKREITSNTDNFFLNGKRTNKHEIKNLLNAVGIYSSNPFFIIEQGTINTVATLSPKCRYEIVRQLAGLENCNSANKFYDRIVTLKAKIEQGTKGKYELIKLECEKINEESKAVKNVQNYNRKLATINYVLGERQLEIDKETVEKLTQTISEFTEKKVLYETELIDIQKNIKDVQKRAKIIDRLLAIKEIELNDLEKELDVNLKEKFSLKMTIKELREETKDENEMRANLAQLNSDFASKQKILEKMQSQYVELRQKEEKHSRELSKIFRQLDILQGKQGRSGQFDSKEIRDVWINEQIRILKTEINNKQKSRENVSRDLECDLQSISALKEKYDQGKSELENYKASLSQCNKVLFELNGAKCKVQDDKNNIWKREREITGQLLIIRDQVYEANQKLSRKIGKPIMDGIEGVQKVLEELKSGEGDKITEHYYGLLIDRFNCDESCYIAVDVVSKTKLFYHVVESVEVATSIIKKFNEMKLPGTLNFITFPMNVREFTYTNEGPHVKSLMDCLSFDHKFRQAMLYTCNRTLLCSNLDIAVKTAKNSRLNCVTFDGDVVQSHGPLFGGYLNRENLSIPLYENYKLAKKEQTKSELELEALQNDLKDLKRTVGDIERRIEQTANEKNQAERMIDKYEGTVRLLKDELSNLENSIESKKQLLINYASDIEDFETKQRAFESELQQDFLSQLSTQEQREADDLRKNIRLLKKTVEEATTARMRLEIEKDKVEREFETNYTRGNYNLEKKINEVTLKKEKLAQKLIELNNVDKKINEIKEKIKPVKDLIENTIVRKRQESDDREKLLEQNDNIKEQMNVITLQLDEVTKKEASVRDRIVDSETKLKNEVFFSRQLHSEYSDQTNALLFKEKEYLVKKIKKLDHCDNKCIRFLDFYCQKKTFYGKLLEEFDVCFEKCQELVVKQEHCTMEQLEFTLAQIKRYFEEIFRAIMPEGAGKVIWLRISEDSGQTNTIGGIDIKVSFNSSDPEMQSIHHLSGGQKSLVAYVFILALQRCDSAPFYILDEIESALESKNRGVLAKLLRQVSSQSQIIVTTFKAELVECTRKCFLVEYYNNLSNITEITREEAIQFVSGMSKI